MFYDLKTAYILLFFQLVKLVTGQLRYNLTYICTILLNQYSSCTDICALALYFQSFILYLRINHISELKYIIGRVAIHEMTSTEHKVMPIILPCRNDNYHS